IGVGIYRATDLTHVVVALQERHLELAPVPRHLPHGAVVPLSGHVEARFSDARLAITRPDGSVSEQEIPLGGGRFQGELRCGLDGAYQVEIEAASGAAV